MSRLRDIARWSRHVVILGGGFIGAEFADELGYGRGVFMTGNEMHGEV